MTLVDYVDCVSRNRCSNSVGTSQLSIECLRQVMAFKETLTESKGPVIRIKSQTKDRKMTLTFPYGEGCERQRGM